MSSLSLIQNKYARLAGISGLIIVSDQVSKAVILDTMNLYQSIPVIRGFFSITHIHNPGGAFGFLAGQHSSLRSGIFILVSSLALALVFYFYKKTPKSHPVLASAFALIFGGAIGNLIDRIRFGKVVDFLDFYIGSYHWPAFNVADSAISVGIAIYLLCLVSGKLPDLK